MCRTRQEQPVGRFEERVRVVDGEKVGWVDLEGGPAPGDAQPVRYVVTETPEPLDIGEGWQEGEVGPYKLTREWFEAVWELLPQGRKQSYEAEGIRLVDVETYLTAGSEYWVPALIPLGAAGLAFAAGTLTARGPHLDAVMLGGVLAGLGGVIARGEDLGLGREAALSGLAIVALGLALLTGGVLDTLRASDVHGWRRLLSGVGALAAVVMVATSLLPLYQGRANLPGDEFTEPLRFTTAADGDATASRILLVGPESTLPGDSRTVRGAAYRVVSAPVPRLWEATLPVPGPVDAALEGVLNGLIEGQESRAGEALAAFGIRWVVVTGDTPLEAVFDGQLDLVTLGGAKRPTFL